MQTVLISSLILQVFICIILASPTNWENFQALSDEFEVDTESTIDFTSKDSIGSQEKLIETSTIVDYSTEQSMFTKNQPEIDSTNPTIDSTNEEPNTIKNPLDNDTTPIVDYTSQLPMSTESQLRINDMEDCLSEKFEDALFECKCYNKNFAYCTLLPNQDMNVKSLPKYCKSIDNVGCKVGGVRIS